MLFKEGDMFQFKIAETMMTIKVLDTRDPEAIVADCVSLKDDYTTKTDRTVLVVMQHGI